MITVRKSLRVLIPFYASADSFQDNVAYTLRKMGHEVMTAPKPFRCNRGVVQRTAATIAKGLFPTHWEEHEKYSVAAARAFRPDLVLCLTQSLRAEILAALRDEGVSRCVAWWGDAPGNMRGMGLLVEGWDAIFLKDQATVAKFRAVGLPAFLLHEAMNPDWHRPDISGSPDDISQNADAVIVAGNYYGYRQYLVSSLAKAGVSLALYGNRPPRWSDSAVSDRFRGRFIVRQEKSRIFRAGLACLNSTHLSEGDSLNCRAFEICGAGGLQLIEDKPSVSMCFEPGKEVLTYRSLDEILDHLSRAREDPAWAQRIRDAGCKRSHDEHRYEDRLARIISVV